MKKYFLSMVVMAVFAIGFTASDEDGSSDSKSPSEQTNAKLQSYKRDKGHCLDMAYAVGKQAAEESANDFIRTGYTQSDLKGLASQQARLKYKTIDNCCTSEFFEKEYPDIFTASEQEKFRQQCIEAYVKGYMERLGK